MRSIIPPLLRCREVGFGVAVQHVLQHLAGVSFRVPVGDHLLVAKHGKIAAEHDAMREPAGDRLLQRRRILPRTPAVQLVADIGLVREHRQHLVLPGIGRPRRQNAQLGITRRHLVDVAGMAVVEHDALAARQALPDPGEAGQDHPRPGRLDRELIDRMPARIARGNAEHLAVHAQPDEAGIGGERTIEFADRLERAARIELQPMAEYDVGMLALEVEGVIVVSADLLDRQEFREREVENHARIAAAKIVGHLVLGQECGLRSPDLLLLRELGLGAEEIAAPGAPVRMAVEEFRHLVHGCEPQLEVGPRRSIRRLILEVCDRPVRWSSPPRSTALTVSRTPSASFRRSASSVSIVCGGSLRSSISNSTVMVSAPPSARSSTQTYSPLLRRSSPIMAPMASGNTLTPRNFTMLSLRPKMPVMRRCTLPQGHSPLASEVRSFML